MHKQAKLSDYQKKILAGAGLGLGTAAAVTLARRRGLRGHLWSKTKGFFTGDKHAVDNISGDIPKQSLNHAREVIKHLRSKGYSDAQLRNLRVGVVGTSGSGKSSLARAFEQELGLERKSLDRYLTFKGLDARTARRELGAPKPGSVYEQSQLVHKYKPGDFDVVVNVSRPTDQIRKSVYKRGYGAVTADYVDFNKARSAVDSAFDLSGAASKTKLNNNISVAISPNTARAEQQRMRAANAAGLDMDRFAKLNQNDQIMSINKGRIVEGKSWMSHTNNKNLAQDVGIGSALVFGGGGAGAYVANKGQKKEAFLLPLATAGVGAAGGAMLGGPDNRITGALSGAMVGAGVGMMPKMLATGVKNTAQKVKNAANPPKDVVVAQANKVGYNTPEQLANTQIVPALANQPKFDPQVLARRQAQALGSGPTQVLPLQNMSHIPANRVIPQHAFPPLNPARNPAAAM